MGRNTENKRKKRNNKKQDDYHPFSPLKQEGIGHTQQMCLRKASQFCGGVNSLLRKKENMGKRFVQGKN